VVFDHADCGFCGVGLMDTRWHHIKSDVLLHKVFLQNGGSFVVKELEVWA
jgi:hypothetical protein